MGCDPTNLVDGNLASGWVDAHTTSLLEFDVPFGSVFAYELVSGTFTTPTDPTAWRLERLFNGEWIVSSEMSGISPPEADPGSYGGPIPVDGFSLFRFTFSAVRGGGSSVSLS